MNQTEHIPALSVRELFIEMGGFYLHVPRLSLVAGTRCAVLGTSGSGKSLFLKALAGLIPGEDEHIYLLGEDICHTIPKFWRRVLYFPQKYSPTGQLTPRQVLWMTARSAANGNLDTLQTVSDMLQRFNLENRADDLIEHMTHTEQQQLVLAQIYAYRRDMLLLDEPLGELTDEARRDMRQYLMAGHPNQTVIYTTSYLEDVVEASDYLVILVNGEIIAQGPTAEVLKHPDMLIFEVTLKGNTSVVHQQLSDVSWIANIETFAHRNSNKWRVAMQNMPNAENALLRAILADRSLTVTNFHCVRPLLTDILKQLRDVG